MDAGHSVFLTGPAGSGKTFVLNQFIKEAKRSGKKVAVTASTGLASTHLGGNTIHAWSGLGVHDYIPKYLISDMSKSRREQITGADILVIDEVSMLHDFRFDYIDQICRAVRDDDTVFGGLQVILSGDFYQLPPVNRDDSKQGGFITNSNAWQELKPVICYLDEQHRQEDDALLEILTAMRANDLRRRHAESLLGRQTIRTPFDDPVTELHTRNVDVDLINLKRLNEMPGENHEFQMYSTGKTNYVDSLKKSCLAPEVLQLKEGAYVMFVKNSLEKKYVNGTLGTIIGFEKGTDLPIVRTTSGSQIVAKPDTWEMRDGDKKLASLTQIPLRLAWAITIHKSQGMTLDAAHIDLSTAFVPGMGYVALSRVRSLEKLSLGGLNKMALTMSSEAHEIDKALRFKSSLDQDKLAGLEKAYEKKLKSSKNKEQSTKGATGWAEKVAKMRETYPNAYTPWKETDDEKLLLLWEKQKALPEISEKLGRHSGAVRMRLEKLLGIEITA